MVYVPRGPFPWERFGIACLLMTVVWFLIYGQTAPFLTEFLGLADDSVLDWLRYLGAPFFVLGYFGFTFHGYHVPGDSFSYFLTSAFHRFSLRLDCEEVVFSRFWLWRRRVQRVRLPDVRTFEIDEGWFVIQTETGRIVICDGPPNHVIKPVIMTLNSALSRFQSV